MAEQLPKDWQLNIIARARASRAPRDAAGRKIGGAAEGAAECAEYAHWLAEYGGARGADLSEDEIRGRAGAVAAMARASAFEAFLNRAETVCEQWRVWLRLSAFIERQGGRIPAQRKRAAMGKWAEGVARLARRVVCPKWWRAQLRRWVAQQYERGAIEVGKVGAGAGSWYCSDQAVRRRIQQVRASEAMMKEAVIESATGQRASLWSVSQKSTSNKTIRRGELMTRIRGCEEWADAENMAGLFTTNTCPSRFHAHRKGGGVNPKHRGESPADAQAWLSKQWARLRAKWNRDGVAVVGFRVAEPHHDGCPHWHMLLWCRPGDVAYVKATMRKYWLQDDGAEAGADRYRVNIKSMIPGQAAGYVAKYIAKNIDDHQITTHTDDTAPGLEVGPDLLGDMEVKPSQRVEAWAATWRIRQFQAIGQPPVTVWRELRRVTEQAAAGGSHALVSAWIAAHRKGERQADWHRYMRAQGGAGLPRSGYRLCVHAVERERAGRYEVARERWACGVVDKARDALAVTPTRRVEWGGEGFASRRVAAPWTRFNNCTVTGRHNRRDIAPTLRAVAESRLALNLGPDLSERDPP
ncbi:replication endonuclease [Variovorax arabinosiphilus]|uniref:replication endonuclease n=1 Tax=Variovorax arabinosiphilus TaxID=3053498 RepID=UPI0025757DC8|nr:MULTISPECIES: replication endonuclease [unclassified Variovorax]MDM0129445.1 replication endonuclease [Variovorax sp. J2L1-63]MDM0232769.1 replication endonuclease [Variovorax sp. J2R1-6]